MSPWAASLVFAFGMAPPIATALAPSETYNDMFGAWSPDGRRIAFTSDRSGDPEIYVANADGMGVARLTNEPGRDAHPSWHPGGAILFQSPREGGNVRIFKINADGSNPRSIASTSGFCGVPVASPNGKQIVFQCSNSLENFGTAEAPWRIFLLDEGERHPRAISHGPGNDQVPVWSPDGRKVLFFSDRSGSNQIYELALASGKLRQLTFGPSSHSSASYSPDGERIALMRAEPGDKGDVYVLGPKGDLVRITDTGPEFGSAMFSPNGEHLLIQLPTTAGWRLHIARSDGGGEPLPLEVR